MHRRTTGVKPACGDVPIFTTLRKLTGATRRRRAGDLELKPVILTI